VLEGDIQEVELKIVCVLCHYLQFRVVPCVVCDLELTFALTFTEPRGMIYMFPQGEPQGSKETLASGEWTRIGNPKGEQVCQ
jgi:hypothetical protein